MGKRYVKTREQYQAAVQGLTREMNRKLAEIRMEKVEIFKQFCIGVLQHAVERAPVEWGALRGSAFLEINNEVVARGVESGKPAGEIVIVSNPVLPKDIIHARVVFDTRYALIQHEHPEYDHPMGGQAYYLETGFDEAVREYAASLRGGR